MEVALSLEHKAGAHPEDTLPLDECVCSICLDIYVEPVTMPCQHTLCMPCFQENCAKVNLRCPMCRRRVSTWMRKAVRNAGLVNRSLWDRVRRSYPQLCQRRLNGQDSIMDEEYYHSPPRLCEPGEMRQEFENMLRKYEEERHKEDELERRMSEEYIAHLLATNKHRSIGSNRTKTLWQCLNQTTPSDAATSWCLPDTPTTNMMERPEEACSVWHRATHCSSKQRQHVELREVCGNGGDEDFVDSKMEKCPLPATSRLEDGAGEEENGNVAHEVNVRCIKLDVLDGKKVIKLKESEKCDKMKEVEEEDRAAENIGVNTVCASPKAEKTKAAGEKCVEENDKVKKRGRGNETSYFEEKLDQCIPQSVPVELQQEELDRRLARSLYQQFLKESRFIDRSKSSPEAYMLRSRPR